MERRVRLATTIGKCYLNAPRIIGLPGCASRASQCVVSSSNDSRRTYAARKPTQSPTVRRAQRAKTAAVPSSPPPSQDVADGKDPQNKTVWDEVKSAFEVAVPLFESEFTPDECTAASMLLVTLKKTFPSITWQELGKKHHLSPYKLHLLGIMLAHPGDSSLLINQLTWMMFQTALSSGYLPTALTLLRLFHMKERSTIKGNALNAYREAKNVLTAHVNNPGVTKDANALTMAGMLLERDGDVQRALNYYQRAVDMHQNPNKAAQGQSENVQAGTGTPSTPETGPDSVQRDVRWEWEDSCLMGIWRLANKLGKHQQALQAVHTAAMELNMHDAHFELAKMPLKNLVQAYGRPLSDKQQHEQREAHLLEAAAHGIPEACRLQAELEDLRADMARDETAAREHRLLAKEWTALGLESETPAGATLA